MDRAELDQQLALARDRVESMDDVDGFKDRDPKTILFALEAGLLKPDSGAAFDAMVMLADVVEQEKARADSDRRETPCSRRC